MVWTSSVGASALLPQRMRVSAKPATLCRQHEPNNDEEVQTPTLTSTQAWGEMRKRFRDAHNPATSRDASPILAATRRGSLEPPCDETVVFVPARRHADDARL